MTDLAQRYGILVTLLLQLGSIVWWASTVNESVQTLKQTVHLNGLVAQEAKDKMLVLQERVLHLGISLKRQEQILEKLDARITDRRKL